MSTDVTIIVYQSDRRHASLITWRTTTPARLQHAAAATRIPTHDPWFNSIRPPTHRSNWPTTQLLEFFFFFFSEKDGSNCETFTTCPLNCQCSSSRGRIRRFFFFFFFFFNYYSTSNSWDHLLTIGASTLQSKHNQFCPILPKEFSKVIIIKL